MNTPSKEIKLFGDQDGEWLGEKFKTFLNQAREIRQKLGAQSYLLDDYLYRLFKTVSMAQVYNRTASGLSAAGELSGMCFGEVTGKPKSENHEFYEIIKDFIDSHPLDIGSPKTKANIYNVLLSSDFTKFAAQQYFNRICDDAYSVLKIGALQDLYTKISIHLGDEEPLKRLDSLFCERFLITSTMAVFQQEMTNQLLYTLISQDSDSSGQIFQLVLNNEYS